MRLAGESTKDSAQWCTCRVFLRFLCPECLCWLPYGDRVKAHACAYALDWDCAAGSSNTRGKGMGKRQFSLHAVPPANISHTAPTRTRVLFGESGLLENEPTVPAEQAHTTLRQ